MGRIFPVSTGGICTKGPSCQDFLLILTGVLRQLRLLLLQGRPISEAVAQYGPFVMNTEFEIQQAIRDYHKDQYGGWPWDSTEPNHGTERGRFARYADGEEELP